MSLVLRDLHLRLGEFTLEAEGIFALGVTVLFGPSGAGKTSLLEAIAGLRGIDRGQISLGDKVLTDATKRIFISPQDRGIGYVPQDHSLFPHLSVRQNLIFGFPRRQVRSARMTFEAVINVLELGNFLARAPARLSSGEKQRVALGRALLADPKLLLLDEPLANLDAALKSRVLPYLLRVRDEFRIPMIYVTHSPEEAVALGEEVVILERGKILRRGRPNNFFLRTEEPRFILKL